MGIKPFCLGLRVPLMGIKSFCLGLRVPLMAIKRTCLGQRVDLIGSQHLCFEVSASDGDQAHALGTESTSGQKLALLL
ncbi:hypothetical protein DUNSADRAFT_8549 [Dunaliella salina]|uniref:Encoded protein n=1 Tax=Dunaliella salina TaxID=3046 RepID=A0ABQ7GJ89_DUNSA|nr:hypothetical protein DUNSADRAFT_8549 [Dunaliella salina]|eukprot:KAF5834667.1 hypothetical protein DUNSADRAFT_8549 [Dunaliella salina]